jgi:hypothetical protein
MATDTAAGDSKTQSWLDASKSNAWTDLALVLPIFLGYHLGVVLLQVRNAADLVTAQLIGLAESNIMIYWGITLAVGAGMVAVLMVLGRGAAFEPKRFVLVMIEGVAYAMLMRLAAAYVVGSLPLGPPAWSPWAGVVMSLGAGFYEEVAFRVALFGLGALAIRTFFGGIPKLALTSGWAVVAAAIFAGWHYIGALGDPFDINSFVFRAVCGLVLTAIFVFRGFAPAVWTHALYDVWALALN